MKKYLILGKVTDLQEIIEKRLKELRQGTGHSTGNKPLDDNEFEIHTIDGTDYLLWSLQGIAETYGLPFAFWMEDKTLDGLNATKEKTGRFPVIDIEDSADRGPASATDSSRKTMSELFVVSLVFELTY